MEELSKRLAKAGASALVLGIVSIAGGVSVGVLSIVSGAGLLRQRRELKQRHC